MKLLKVIFLYLLLNFILLCKADAATFTTTVSVNSRSAPWLSSANPTFHSVLQGSSAPTIISSVQGMQIKSGDIMSIQYLTGTARAGSGWSLVDAGGQINFPVNDGVFYGQHWASSDVPHDQYPVYALELLGAFANQNGVVIDSPFVVGNFKDGLIVPNGATQLQLGVNDTYFIDNTGSFNMRVSLQEAPESPAQAPVPEPSSIILGLMGISGIIGLRRKRH